VSGSPDMRRATHESCDQARLTDALLSEKHQLELLQRVVGCRKIARRGGWCLRCGHDGRRGWRGYGGSGMSRVDTSHASRAGPGPEVALRMKGVSVVGLERIDKDEESKSKSEQRERRAVRAAVSAWPLCAWRWRRCLWHQSHPIHRIRLSCTSSLHILLPPDLHLTCTRTDTGPIH
jgi:hypothetical protein